MEFFQGLAWILGFFKSCMDVSDMQVNFLEYVKVLGDEPKNTVSTFLEKTTTQKEVDSFSNCGTCYRREDRML